MLGAKQDFAALTTLRAVGALCVVQYHAWLFVYPAWPESWVFHGIELWPDYFFALSGFILMHVYGTSLFSRRDGLYNYFIHRIARIYPLHIFVLAVLILFETMRWGLSHWYPDINGSAFSGNTSPKYILTNLLLIQAWGIQSINSWNVPAWSVSAEFACYLIFPLLVYYGIIARKATTVVLVLIAVAGLAWIQFTRHTFNVTHDLGVPRAFFSFSLGCVLYRYRATLLQALAFIPPLLLQAAVIVAVITAYAVNAMPILYIPLWILLIASFTYEQTALARALSWKPLVHLGEMSYSLYMVHAIILWPLGLSVVRTSDLFQSFLTLPPVLILLVILGSTYLLSIFTYHYVEVRMRAYIRKRFDRKGKPATNSIPG